MKSKDIYKEFDVLSLESMLTKAREDLSDFHNTVTNGGKGDWGIKEHKFEEETVFEIDKIVEIYSRRVR